MIISIWLFIVLSVFAFIGIVSVVIYVSIFLTINEYYEDRD